VYRITVPDFVLATPKSSRYIFLPEINGEKLKDMAGSVIAGLTRNLNPRIRYRLTMCRGLRVKPAMTDGVVALSLFVIVDRILPDFAPAIPILFFIL
jgi:hypothetical protein